MSDTVDRETIDEFVAFLYEPDRTPPASNSLIDLQLVSFQLSKIDRVQCEVDSLVIYNFQYGFHELSDFQSPLTREPVINFHIKDFGEAVQCQRVRSEQSPLLQLLVLVHSRFNTPTFWALRFLTARS